MTLRLVASSLLGLSASFGLVSAESDKQIPLANDHVECPDYVVYSSYPQYVFYQAVEFPLQLVLD